MSDKDSKETIGSSHTPILIAIVVAAAIFIALAYFGSSAFFIDVADRLRLASIAGNFVLTIGLIVVYSQLVKSTGNQEKIMEEQHSLQKSNYKPVLQLTQMRIERMEAGVKMEKINESNLNINITNQMHTPAENITMVINNMGPGVGVNLEVDTRVQVTSEGLEYTAMKLPLKAAGDSINQGGGSIRGAEGGGQSLKEIYPNQIGKEKQRFQLDILFRMDSEAHEYLNIPFSVLVEKLRNDEIDEANLKIDITYEDVDENEYVLKIVDTKFDVNDTKTLEEAIFEGEQKDPDIEIRENPIN